MYCISYGNIIEHWSQCGSFLSYLLDMAEEARLSTSRDSASLFFCVPGDRRCNSFAPLNPFASIGRYLTSKGKVKVKVICLNISFLT